MRHDGRQRQSFQRIFNPVQGVLDDEKASGGQLGSEKPHRRSEAFKWVKAADVKHVSSLYLMRTTREHGHAKDRVE
ncbi:MAG TPA: hypothetical protein DCX75_06065, partial [Brevundimonas sp.]|nr:hypothetical protein [Brevundimonas sp.]